MAFSAAAYIEKAFANCIRGLPDLHEEQCEAVEWAWDRPFSALFLDVGYGKTVIIETILDRLFLQGFAYKILIIAPIRVATRVWMQEHKLWRHLAYFDPTLLRVDDDDPRLADLKGRMRTARKAEFRRHLLRSRSPIHVINQEAVGWLVNELLNRKQRWPYPVVIFDESSRLRDHNSEVFKALKSVLPEIRRFHQLTATPASQTYMHLFSQIYLLDHGERFGTHITPFRERYFTHNHYNRTWTIREGAAEEIEKKIADICLVMRRVRDFRINVRPIRLPRKIMQQYRDFERDSILELPDDVVIDAINGAALSNKLLQYASGAVYNIEPRLNPITGDPVLDAGGNPMQRRVSHIIHDEKIEELRQLADETLDNPILVAYWYKSSLARLVKAFPKAAVMDREGKIEEQWNKRKFKIMFVHPRSVAHGMNLQFGGHHVALFDIFWPLELFTQLIGRLDRQGQTDTVMVHLLSAIGTMDETVSENLRLLQHAEDSMFRRLSALRRKMRDVRKSDQLQEL